MEGLWNMLAFIGAVFVGSGLLALIIWLGVVIKRVHRVARDYHESAPSPDSWGTSNYFTKLQDGITETKKRLYLAERNSSNATYQIRHHAQDYKHTKTAKKVAIDKERKKAEQEYQHDADVRGCGDGM